MFATTFETVNGLPARPCEMRAQVRNCGEADAVARLKAGDQAVFRELVDRYQSKIRNVTSGILGSREDADEIAQEVFAKVYFALPSFDARSSLYTWIYRIAVNECYGFLRKRRLRPVYENDSSDGTLRTRMQSVADPSPVTDRAVMQRDFVNKLLARVPENDRLLLLLKEVEGFSLAELSEMTGLNLNTLKVRLFRTRQRLIKAAAQLESPRIRSRQKYGDYTMNRLITTLWIGVLGGWSVVAAPPQEHAVETTRMARQLVLERIDEIAQNGHCRQAFGKEKIDLNLLRFTVEQTRFYDVAGREGNLRFSAVVGKLASPDRTLRVLASEVEADAFVLGYYDADRYVRTRHVVLTRGYHEQPDPSDGRARATTMEEKQNLLLHEILHIALGKDDDDLNSRDLCPLRLLAFCPRSRTASAAIEGSPASE